MRERTYPGSEITIEETLQPGSNYSRYRASYQSDGLKIYALLTVPNGEKPATGWPVIIFNHGFIPPDQYRTTERYVAYVDWLARNGYIVLRSDYRGHDQSEGEARGAYGAPDYTVDVMNALSSMQQYPEADPNRIGMWGHSMGGYITLRSMVITDTIKAGVIWARRGGAISQSVPTPDRHPHARRGNAGTDDNSHRHIQSPLAIGAGRDLRHARRESRILEFDLVARLRGRHLRPDRTASRHRRCQCAAGRL